MGRGESPGGKCLFFVQWLAYTSSCARTLTVLLVAVFVATPVILAWPWGFLVSIPILLFGLMFLFEIEVYRHSMGIMPVAIGRYPRGQ